MRREDMREHDGSEATGRSSPAPARLPVVARIVVEVCSDGTETRSYAVLEDMRSGYRSQLVMPGAWPGASVALLRNLLTASAMARRVVRAVMRPGESWDPDAEAAEHPGQAGTR
jgi:hypothetical protein